MEKLRGVLGWLDVQRPSPLGVVHAAKKSFVLQADFGKVGMHLESFRQPPDSLQGIQGQERLDFLDRWFIVHANADGEQCSITEQATES